MATLRDYFETDSRVLRQHCGWRVRLGESKLPIDAYLECDFTANAKYWSVYVPDFIDPVFAIKALIQETTLKTGEIENDPTRLILSGDTTGQMTLKSDLVFTHRVLFYVEDDVSQHIPELQQYAATVGLRPFFYGSEYVKNRSASEKPLAFISHDSRDKESIARELAVKLSGLMCPVWYDEFSLTVGDNLRESIDRGLKEARYCILILSPNFFANEGWGRAEFDSIFAREMVEKRDVILPVWHNVTKDDVFNFNARLSNKLGIPSTLGIDTVAAKLSSKIKAA